ncbi:MAG: hypothetical protein IJ048_06130 [Clostridia bacterium]|nr:hypothetical protein [Clostridia bacterium]
MKSNTIRIDNQGNGFSDAIEEARKVAAYNNLEKKATVQLEMLTHELLSLARSVTGELQASFWIEGEERQFDLHLNTKTVMDKEKRFLLLSSATTRKNDAAKGFLGKLRDAFEEAMTADVDHSHEEIPYELLNDVSGHEIESSDWDGYERSILRKLADNVKIAIRGGVVDMTVSKRFAE